MTFVSLAFLFLVQATVPLSHPAEFWRAVVAHEFTPPAGSDLSALTTELSEMLASPDPELRDEIAYSTLASWIFQKRTLDADALNTLTERLLANLQQGIGERDTDTVFRRSFSALVLSVVIARDNAAPFLSVDRWRRVDERAVAYLSAEQDVRGYDPVHGWMHS